jgi:hypothetical protein
VRCAAALLAGLALGVAAHAQAGTWSRAGSVAAGYDSNIGNAGHRENRRDVASLHASAGVGWERRFGLFTALQLQGAASAEPVFGIGRLSNAGVTGRLRVLHKPGKGFYTPVLAAWVATGARDYGSRIRDSMDYRIGASAAVPLTTAVQTRAEVVRVQRESRRRVYDLGYSSYALTLDWAAAERLVVYATVRLNDGPFVVSVYGEGDVEPKAEHRYLEDNAEAIEADPAFGTGWWAFRMDGETRIDTLGLNVPLTDSFALDLQVQHSDARSAGYGYERWLGSAGLLFRW